MTERITILATTSKFLLSVWHQHNSFHPFAVFVIIHMQMRCCLVNHRIDWANRVKKGSLAQLNTEDVSHTQVFGDSLSYPNLVMAQLLG